MDIGNILLISTIAIFAVNLFFIARAAGGHEFSLITAGKMQHLATVFIFFASIYLLTLLLNDRFDFAYVYGNSSKDMGAAYKIAAFWAGHEGSMLLWLLFVSLTGSAVVRYKNPHETVVLAVISITAIYMLALLLAQSPFAYLWDKFPDAQRGFLPPDGTGMNPLLMDPWMLTHPPVLFAGYAAAAVPFGMAVGALIKKDFSALSASGSRWLLFSVVTLGLGIFMGGYWAYKVLGWGGYWGWDPVENSSLIPWLFGVALIHGLILQRRKGALVKTNIALALLYFILVIYSAFLTRSGILSDFSVHSFTDQGLGKILLSMLAVFTIAGAALFAAKFRQIKSNSLELKLLSWDTITVLGIAAIILYALFILIGTSMPILTFFKSSVTVKFYNTLSIPFGIAILILMTLSLVLTKGAAVQKKILIVSGVLSIVFGALFNIAFTSFIPAYLFSAAGIFMIVYHSIEMYSAKGSSILPSRIAHIGVGVMVLGVIASGFHGSGESKTIFKDRESIVGPASVTFRGIKTDIRSKLQFTIKSASNPKEIETLYYHSERMNSDYREPHIEYGFLGDIYVIPSDYKSGTESVSSLIIEAGTKTDFAGLKIEFVKFNTGQMRSENPSISADLVINGNNVRPVYRLIAGRAEPVQALIPGSGRAVFITGIDVQKKLIALHITPGKETVVPPDSVTVDVSVKRLIWFVWLGTILISAGMVIALVKRRGD